MAQHFPHDNGTAMREPVLKVWLETVAFAAELGIGLAAMKLFGR